MKKFTALLMIAILMLTMGAAVSAATLSDVVSALQTAKVPASYISQAESYFTAYPLTSTQADQLIANINAASAVAAGATDLEALSTTQVSKIMVYLKDAASAVNLKASLTRAPGVEGTRSNDNDVVAVYDATGKLVIAVSEAKAVKQTGYDYSLVLIGLLTVLLAGVTAVAGKIRKVRAH